MGFFLKKLVAVFLYPVPIILMLMAAGLILLWRKRAPRAARAILTSAFGLLFLLSFRPVGDAAIRSIESRHAVHEVNPADTLRFAWIVVLDGGYADVPGLPPEQKMSQASLARFVEGMRLARAYPHARLLFSGGSFSESAQTTGSEVMRDAAVERGIDPDRIRIEHRSWDTDDQARLVRDIVQHESFLLVTAAAHMPRSVALFRKQGLDPTPAPAGFTVRRRGVLLPGEYIPSSENLLKVRAALYEWMGIWYARLRGLA